MIISESKQENYYTEVSNGNSVVFSDVTEEKGGKGQHLRLHDLPCAGFTSCINITRRMVLERKNIKYEKVIRDLEEQKENINKAIKELTDLGWSGEAKDKFMEVHIKKQEFYTNLIEKMKYEKNVLENGEKPRAIQLKKRCENLQKLFWEKII